MVLLVLSGCGPLHRLSASSTPAGAIPWLPLPADLSAPPVPSPKPVPIPPGTSACTADQLHGGFVGHNGAGGDYLVGFAFAGAGQVDCFLDGIPAVTLFDAVGRALPFRIRAPFAPPDAAVGPALVSPGPAPEEGVGLKYGQAALTIDWISQPEQCPGQDAVLPASARIDIPAGGTLTVTVPVQVSGYTCQGLGVGPFESPPAYVEPAPAPPMPKVTVRLGGSAVAGKPFQYFVILTNDTMQSIDLAARCPSYEEEMLDGGLPVGGKHFYMLNCAPAGNLAPGATATFQMLFSVPGDVAPGKYTLLFSLLDFNALDKPTELPVEISRG